MKVGDSKGVASTGRLSATDKKAGVGAAAYARAADSATKAPAISDIAAILDVPETEFTPKVRTAIMALMAEVEKLRRDLQQKEARIAHLEQLADQDPLTPVANRRAFVRELTRMMSFADRYDTVSSMIYFDLNGLKPINDTYGHAIGDALLVAIAAQLRTLVRDTDLAARLGGDEFAILLAQTTELSAIESTCARIVTKLGEPLIVAGRSLKVGASIGIVASPLEGASPDELYRAADTALYQAKQAGRSTWRWGSADTYTFTA